ncbi:hypothetical protein [Leptolyngbya iicbica]|uniref:Uncharacterized protein n=2 Tax=Cyanophyceae TaxID=3028117 RepID=A0A4Q7EDN9_9CYAN|nr:hypothetical protein [Leptolyngbya sp. LK]RZM81894.1 hypothetical protein DYY88_01065 [Leptolyngbya sp. LK]
MSNNHNGQPDPNSSDKYGLLQLILAFLFGASLIVALLGIAFRTPNPTAFQFFVFRVVLALAAAGVAAIIPGLINVNISGIVKAGGAIAVFVLIYLLNPASLVIDDPRSPQINQLDKLHKELALLSNDWERLDEMEENANPCQQIRRQASNIGERFHLIQDSSIEKDLGAQIAKYHYSQYAYLIASDVECDEISALKYARIAIEDGETAFQLIDFVKQDTSEEAMAWINWMYDEKNFIPDRINFNTALAFALLHRYGGMSTPDALNMIESKLTEINTNYYEGAGISLNNNRILKPLLTASALDSDSYAAYPCALTCPLQQSPLSGSS